MRLPRPSGTSLTRTDQPQAAGYNCLLLVEELTAGQAFQMRSPTGRIVNVVGTIDECEPPRRLKQTMKYPQLDEEFTSLWEIDDAPDGGVDVTLTVEGLPPEGKPPATTPAVAAARGSARHSSRSSRTVGHRSARA